MVIASSSRANPSPKALDIGGLPLPVEAQGVRRAARYSYTYADVVDMAERYSNWGRWGPDDEIGTVNFITPAKVTEAARLVRAGRVISLSIPFDANGPQDGVLFKRFNPMHYFARAGGDIELGLGGAADDIIIMPLQAATQWDALSHPFFRKVMYNGFGTEYVSSKEGATRNSITQVKDRIVSRGVLLDIPRYRGVEWLEPGEIIYVEDLEGAAAAAHVEIRSGDILLVRTGAIAKVRAENDWGGYGQCHASAGLSLSTAEWLFKKEIAAVAADNVGVEVFPSEIPDHSDWEDVGTKGHDVPLHRVSMVHTGLMFGEIFDLEALADDCAKDGLYEFMFVGQPLVVTGAVGSPLNPLAIK